MNLFTETRQTYRAVLSEPRLILPTQLEQPEPQDKVTELPTAPNEPNASAGPSNSSQGQAPAVAAPPKRPLETPEEPTTQPVPKKRKRDKKKGNI